MKLLNRINNYGFSHVEMILALVVIIAIAFIGVRVLNRSNAQTTSGGVTCSVSVILVNSCHPWFGAAIGGDPNAPGGAGASKTAQFEYLESLIGRKIDLYHDYHSPGSNPLNSDETYFADRANTVDYINWKPASTWAAADGGNQTVNNSIKAAADNIKAIAPHKVFLTVWHEPENDVSAFDNSTQSNACKNSSTFTGLKGGAGTPSQYVAMWQNVRNIFNQEGVTNVVWVMNYMGYKNWDCLIPYMWPGNNLVDWVTMDAYGSGSSPSWDTSVGRIYNTLAADSNATDNFTAKPWGTAEYGVCGTSDTQSQIVSYYTSAKAALDNHSYPNLKMYMVYDSANGPGGTAGCLVDRSAAELTAFKNFANDPIFTNTSSPNSNPTINSFSAAPSSVTSGQTTTLSWITSNTNGCSVSPGGPQNTQATSWMTPAITTTGTQTYTLTCTGSGSTVSKTAEITATPDTTSPTITRSAPTGGANLSGTITVSGTTSDNVGVSYVSLRVDDTWKAGINNPAHQFTYTYDTAGLSNGKHSLYLRAWDAAGNHTDTPAITVYVKN